MPILPIARHELFAQEMAKGKTATEAYVIAGYKPNDGNAAKLAKKVRGRIMEITGVAAQRTGVTVERVLNELALIGFSNMQDYMKVGPDGDPHLDFSNLTREQAAALAEVTVEEFRDGSGEEARDVRRVKFKLADKRAALVDIGKHLGMFIDRTDIRVHAKYEGVPLPKLVEHLSSLTKRLADESGDE